MIGAVIDLTLEPPRSTPDPPARRLRVVSGGKARTTCKHWRPSLRNRARIGRSTASHSGKWGKAGRCKNQRKIAFRPLLCPAKTQHSLGVAHMGAKGANASVVLLGGG
jgi:hypothetical protein